MDVIILFQASWNSKSHIVDDTEEPGNIDFLSADNIASILLCIIFFPFVKHDMESSTLVLYATQEPKTSRLIQFLNQNTGKRIGLDFYLIAMSDLAVEELYSHTNSCR